MMDIPMYDLMYALYGLIYAMYGITGFYGLKAMPLKVREV